MAPRRKNATKHSSPTTSQSKGGNASESSSSEGPLNSIMVRGKSIDISETTINRMLHGPEYTTPTLVDLFEGKHHAVTSETEMEASKIKDVANHLFGAKSGAVGSLAIVPHVPIDIPHANRGPEKRESSQPSTEAPPPPSSASQAPDAVLVGASGSGAPVPVSGSQPDPEQSSENALVDKGADADLATGA
uniref:Integrase core domain containing protein n=1 Tax=Solanum tuberosum TaxID=4113 RepID=M1DTY9_SOLTU